MTNKYFFTTTINAPSSRIFEFYKNVSNWYDWDEELESSSLIGNFENNSKGNLKPKGSSELEFTLQNVQKNVGFEQIINLPFGSKFILTRNIKELENNCEVTHSGYFEGWFGAVLGLYLKQKYTPLLKKSVLKLKELVELQ
jgi:hypothetical protein